MAGYINTGKGLLVLPGGVEAPFGVEVDVPDGMLSNPAVAGWIVERRMVLAENWRPVAQDSVDVLLVERDALRAEVARLDGEVARLTADLQAALAPKK